MAALPFFASADDFKALAALKRAVEKGFKDIAALTGDTALESLRKEDEYKALVEKLKVSP